MTDYSFLLWLAYKKLLWYNDILPECCPDSDLTLGQFRVLEVDNKVIIPVDCHIRLIVTAADVLHSFAVPSLGIKIDAVPGDGP